MAEGVDGLAQSFGIEFRLLLDVIYLLQEVFHPFDVLAQKIHLIVGINGLGDCGIGVFFENGIPGPQGGVGGVFAEQLLRRDFENLADLAAAAGKAPGALSLPMGALGVVSRCFRVVSNGAYANVDEDGRVYRASQRHAEAVVTLDAAGKATTRLWREAPGRYEDAGVG